MSRRPFAKAGVVRDPAFYALWNRLHPHCQVCGIRGVQAIRQRWPGLSSHHLIKKARSDEGCNLLRLCQRCHDLAELHAVGDFPLLTLAILLTVKRTREPGQYDAARLTELLHKSLPEPEPIPDVFEREFRAWQH